MELADVPRHRPLAFDKMECLIKEMQDSETGVPVRSQKLFLTVIPSAFMGYDLVEWLMDRFNLDETSNVEAINLANQLCQYGYFFPVNDLKNLVLKDDSSLYRFQSPYYWPWQGPRVAGSGSSAPSIGPDNVEYAIYLVKRTLRNKQRHALEDYEQEALANLKKNLAGKWDFITMQAEEQVRLAKDRKKGDKIVSDSQERAYWRVARPPPGVPGALEPCPVPVRARRPRARQRSVQQLRREVEHLKASLDRTRVKTSIALEALVAYSETFTPYDPWLTPPQPSNPWISDDTLFWQINSPIVEVPSEKRVQRWAISIEELVQDPTGLQEFTSFLRKEYSHENIRFWLAVMDLRRSGTKQIPKKLDEIYQEFLKPGAPCEINIDGATAERVAEGLRSGSRYALDHAAGHVYGLLLKKDCYPRFVRSDHFQRLLTEGRNVHQKKAKFFNFGGQVKRKPGSASGTGAGAGGGAAGGAALARRRGSDRSLSGSAHELAACAAQPPRAPDAPPHSHSQSNLCDIPFRDPLDDGGDDVLPWEGAAREGARCAARRRQDSAADSGSSSSDLSAAVCASGGAAGAGGERARRLPQQSTLDGGLRGAPPPLRRLSAVEPRHLAPLASPPHSPRRARPPPPAQHHPPPHPTPTISVSSAPDDDSPSPPDRTADPPPSVFSSAAATPTELTKSIEERVLEKTISPPSCDNSVDLTNVEVRVRSAEGSAAEPPPSESDSDRTRDVASEPGTLPPTIKEISPASSKDSSKIGDLPGSPERECVGISPGVTVPVPLATSPVALAVMPGVAKESVPAKEPISAKVSIPIKEPSVAKEPIPAKESTSARESTSTREPAAAVAPLAECEDSGADDDRESRASSPPPRGGRDATPASDATPTSDATPAPDATTIAHKDNLSSVSESSIVKRDNNSDVGDCKKRNDVCPWEDENSCESDAPFVKTYATLGYL